MLLKKVGELPWQGDVWMGFVIASSKSGRTQCLFTPLRVHSRAV